MLTAAAKMQSMFGIAALISAGLCIALITSIRGRSTLAKKIFAVLTVMLFIASIGGFLQSLRQPSVSAEMEDLRTRIARLESGAGKTRIVDVNKVIEDWADEHGYSKDQALRLVQNWVSEMMREPQDSPRALTAKYLRKSVLDTIVGSSPIALIPIPSGFFAMGSDVNERGRDPDEGPKTEVKISYSFWIGEHEVTQGEYNTLRLTRGGIRENPSVFNGDRSSWKLKDYGHNDQRPVDNISWEEANEFCRALTQQELKNLPPGFVYRLPTEAEWEYACRAGTKSRFYFGDDDAVLIKYGWMRKNAVDRTRPVCLLMPNAWGVCDMHGNVMEWCWDYYSKSLPGGRLTDPKGPRQGSKRVLRGGSWESDNSREFRCADRFGLESTNRGWAYGFRIVLGPPIESLHATD